MTTLDPPEQVLAILQELRILGDRLDGHLQPEYQALAEQYARLVHGFGRGNVVDIADRLGKTDNMPILVESIELRFTRARRGDKRIPVRITGPIFCNNPAFDGHVGEGTCTPHEGDKFIILT